MEETQTPCNAEPQARPTTTRINGDRRRDFWCRGLNHSDEGQLSICDACGAEVIQWFDGNNRKKQVTSYGYGIGQFCFAEKHECDPERVAKRAEKVEQDGIIVKGSRVVVVKGRKYAKGTAGTVFWVAPEPDGYDVVKVGFTSDEGEKIFININNIQKETNQ
jgi:hypothetical protein